MIGNNLYNLVSYTIYDDLGRVIATVRNYDDPDQNGVLELTSERNFITRTYYDGLGRPEFVVTNFVGDITSPIPPAFNPSMPDRNLVTRYLYDEQGHQIATVSNYWDPNGGTLTEADILAGLPDRNPVTRTYYNARRQVTNQVSNFVGDITSPVPPTFVPAAPDRNLVTQYTYDLLGRQVQTTIDRGIAGSRVSQTEYDPLGRTAQTIANYQDGTPGPGNDVDVTTSLTYQALGRITMVTNPAGVARQTIADALGRIVQSVVDPGGLALTTTTTYDVARRPIMQANGEGETTQTIYNALGQAV